MTTTCTATTTTTCLNNNNNLFKFESVKKALQPIFISPPSAKDLELECQETTVTSPTNFINSFKTNSNALGLRSKTNHLHNRLQREQHLFLEADLNESEWKEILINQVSLNQDNESRRQNQLIYYQKEIDSVRETIRLKVSESPDKFYPEDIEKFTTDPWPVLRFFPEDTSQSDISVEKIIQNVVTCLKWRKEVRIREITLKYFPQQFFQTGLFNFGVDVKTGKRVILIRGRQHKKLSELTEQFIRFGSCLYEKIDNDLKGNKVTLFLDLSDVSLESADVAMIRHVLDLLFNYFPSVLDQVFIYEASWYLRPLVFFILKVVPEKYAKLVSMISKKDIQSMDPSSVPDLIEGGTMKTTSLEVPEGAISLDQFVEEQGLHPGVVEKAKKLYKLSW